MGTVIVKNLGKAYKVYPNRFARLKEWLLPFTQPRHSVKWVLQDINFTINSGEAVGIIGVNGAGKSTLLKMLTGTTQPTTGSVQTTGRVAALLELGIGFHPEFTGRQNAMMAGQLLGMRVEEIRQLMPQIESFAEIGEYIDQPVRVYSSGMQMRLAFSVATAMRPDILIVDEALSVGDAYFQHKSFERIRNFRKQGTTLLMVSHDKQAIQSICDRAILINEGKLAMEGAPALITDYYSALTLQKKDTIIKVDSPLIGASVVVSGNNKVKIEDVSLINSQLQKTTELKVGEEVQLHIKAMVLDELPKLIVGYLIKDRLGQPIYGTNTQYTGQPLFNCNYGDNVEFQATFKVNLGPGSYSISLSFVDTDGTALLENYLWLENSLVFNITNIDKDNFIGSSWLQPTITLSKQ